MASNRHDDDDVWNHPPSSCLAASESETPPPPCHFSVSAVSFLPSSLVFCFYRYSDVQGGPIKTVSLNVINFFNFPSDKSKTDSYMSKSSQFRVCEQILLFVLLIHKYILQNSWNYPSLTKTQCILWHTLFTLLCVYIRRKNVSWKFIEPYLTSV